jgi:Protein of unknown function (DUF998)
MVSVGLFVVLVGALHILRPETNPMTRAVSYYALGSYGFLMSIAFLLSGLAGIALTGGLFHASAKGHRSTTGLILLGIWSVTLALLALFPLDAPGAPITIGAIHGILGMDVFLVAAALLVSRRLTHDSRWHAFSCPTIVIAWVLLVVALRRITI